MSRLLSLSNARQLVVDRWNILLLLPRAGAGTVTSLALTNVAAGLLPVAFVVATSNVIGEIPSAVAGGWDSSSSDSLMFYFIVATVAFVVQQVVAPLQASLGELLARRVDGHVFGELMSTSLSTAGIRPLEDQAVLDDLQVAASDLESGFQSPGEACAGLLALVARYVQLVGYIMVVGAAFSWLAAAALAAVVVLFRYGHRGGLRKYGKVRFDLAGAERKVDYLRQLAIQPEAGKEIRIFGLTGWLREALTDAYVAWLKPLWKTRRRVYLWPFVWFSLLGLATTGVLFALVGVTASDRLTLTSFALVMQAALASLRLAEYYPEADLQTTIGMTGYEGLRRFVARIEAYQGDAMPPEERPVSRLVPEPAKAIHFDHVTFRYPGQREPVFDALDLTIPVGRCTAVVGMNGAGKTTLVKLLARLYEPDDGVIRVDGVDIRSYPLPAWRAKLGVIFQDFLHYDISAADNIAFGAVESADDRPGIRAAAEAAGIAGALDRLPSGMDTPLARHLAGGAELSGGQWQRVALARALFALRHGSSIVVLDEPTASLDVQAEAHFFDEFAGLTQGATTLLISHRFSTVRRADLIVVLERGRVLEHGTHEKLLSVRGRYAELFRLQAERFADAGIER